NNGALLSDSRTFSNEVNQPEFYADLNSGEFEGVFDWTENRVHASQAAGEIKDSNHTGHAVYSSLSYANDIFGLTVEYKNFNYFQHRRDDRTFEGVLSKSPLSNPPEVYKE